MFRKMSKKYFEPVSMWLMIFGIISTVQPWWMLFHVYGVVITLIGLVSFIFVSHIKPLPVEEPSDLNDEFNVSRREEGPVRKQNLVIEKSSQERTKAQGNEESRSLEKEEKGLSIVLQESE
jgi:hypothetical protein